MFPPSHLLTLAILITAAFGARKRATDHDIKLSEHHERRRGRSMMQVDDASTEHVSSDAAVSISTDAVEAVASASSSVSEVVLASTAQAVANVAANSSAAIVAQSGANASSEVAAASGAASGTEASVRALVEEFQKFKARVVHEASSSSASQVKMIGMLFSFLELPMMLMMCGGMFAAFCCGGWCCCRCRNMGIRDIGCFKWLLRKIGHDAFDDFSLLVHVHELVSFSVSRKDPAFSKIKFRITAGRESCDTPRGSKGIFECSLTILVAQGTKYLIVDLLADNGVVLGQLKLGIEKDILSKESPVADEVHSLREKSKGCPVNPKVRLTICKSDEADLEGGFESGETAGMSFATNLMMQRALNEAEEAVASRELHAGGDMAEIERLMQACSGPAEVFGTLGHTSRYYLGVKGPPFSRRFLVGLWADQAEYDNQADAVQECDLTKVTSIQTDPSRTDIFVIGYTDHNGLMKKWRCQIVSRKATVWVELFHRLIPKVKEFQKVRKKNKALKDQKIKAKKDGQKPAKV